MPPMTLNAERLYQNATDLRAQLDRGELDDASVRGIVGLVLDVILSAIDHPYPTPRDAG